MGQAKTNTSKKAKIAPVITDATLRKFLGYNMKLALNVLLVDLSQALKPFGLRMMTFSALQVVYDNPGLRQSQLADALSIERPNLVVILDQLEEQGMITRDKVPTDRRAYALNLTVKGRRLTQEAIAAVAKGEKQLLGDLDPTIRQKTIDALQFIEHSKGGADR